MNRVRKFFKYVNVNYIKPLLKDRECKKQIDMEAAYEEKNIIKNRLEEMRLGIRPKGYYDEELSNVRHEMLNEIIETYPYLINAINKPSKKLKEASEKYEYTFRIPTKEDFIKTEQEIDNIESILNNDIIEDHKSCKGKTVFCMQNIVSNGIKTTYRVEIEDETVKITKNGEKIEPMSLIDFINSNHIETENMKSINIEEIHNQLRKNKYFTYTTKDEQEILTHLASFKSIEKEEAIIIHAVDGEYSVQIGIDDVIIKSNGEEMPRMSKEEFLKCNGENIAEDNIIEDIYININQNGEIIFKNADGHLYRSLDIQTMNYENEEFIKSEIEC